MERLLLPVGAYESILAQIGKWKVISLKELCNIMAKQVGYKGLAKQITRLEKQGFISSFFSYDNNKYIYLTNKGRNLSPSGVNYCRSEENLNHDLKCSMVLRELLNFENFTDGEMLGEKTDSLSPDAKILAKKNHTEYVLALELELNQKSKDRIKEKFKKYSSYETYSYVLYVFQKPEVMNAYTKILQGMTEMVQKKIILLLDAKLSNFNFDFRSAVCFFRGELRNFESIFG
ncbi:MAG: hypothetical protein A2202_02940 [Bdellovibrionales bacterium RIFOXYA1_FULL_36_14]|nr:MAG: hypothetical protein A2202_02940 [Bdellovibrionales bacterium RIFOXYA1_FULL_36_14]